MSLQVLVNITKGWPSPFIVEKSLTAGAGVTLTQGLIATIASTGLWQLGVTTVDQVPFLITVDATDPSTSRGAYTGGTSYKQVAYGAIQGIGFNNALEIEVANYGGSPYQTVTLGVGTTTAYAIGAVLSAPATATGNNGVNGTVQPASSNQIIIATVTAAPYQRGNWTYLTFIPVPSHNYGSYVS
jgi:hypothetical protein